MVMAHGHPVAAPGGRVFEHRRNLYDAIGAGPHPCHWCGLLVAWDRRSPYDPDALVVDHLDYDKLNNDPTNLVPSCLSCNAARAARRCAMTDADLEAYAKGYYLPEAQPPDVALEERVQAWIMPWLCQQVRGRTLEMGFGTGLTTRYLVEAGVDLTVVEGAPSLAALARRAIPGKVHQSLFEAYDPGPVFDTVLALHVLEHVEDPVRMLERMRGWLRPWGRVIVVVPNAQSVHRQVGQLMTGLPLDYPSERDLAVGHRRVYTMRRLRGDVSAVGLQVDREIGWFLKPVNNARMVDWAPELIDALCEIGWEGLPEDAANIGLMASKRGR